MKSAKELIIIKILRTGGCFIILHGSWKIIKTITTTKRTSELYFMNAFMICWSLREATGLRETSGTIS